MIQSIKKVLLTSLLASFGVVMIAQNNQRPNFPPQLNAEQKANNIANQLALDDETATKFVATYTEYQQELRDLRKENFPKRSNDSLRTDEEVEQSLQAEFKMQQERLDLQKKYYEKYRKFLSPKQIERVYMLEREQRGDMRMHPNMQNMKRERPNSNENR